MTQYNSLNVKFSNSELNKLKSAVKNTTEVTLKLSPNLIGKANDETNFPHKLLLTDRKVLKLRNTFVNNSSTKIKLSTCYVHVSFSENFANVFMIPSAVELQYEQFINAY